MDEDGTERRAPAASDRPAGADGAPAQADSLSVTAAALATALGVPVRQSSAERPTLRFQQAIRHAEGLLRRGVLDLAARRFRTTLWAGDHRCLDHLELDHVQTVACDPEAGRLVVASATVRLVLSRQGALTVVPLVDSAARVGRRPPPADVGE
jgi:hypothetical protein